MRPRSSAVRGSTLVAVGLAALAFACVSPAAAATGERTAHPDPAAVYGGIGSWLDIFARSAWSSPGRVVASLKAHGVSTLYLQTSNYSQPDDIVNPSAVGRFLDAAHAAGLHVAAWYLPSFADPTLDRRRALAAIHYRSATGQRFDSFALDIEASVVHSVALRNARLTSLALALRSRAPTGYPLGAIIPSPVGMRRHPHYWPEFPYVRLAHIFDVFLPMAYFSYSAKTPSAAYAYARDVVVAIRQATERPDEPIHVIGGIANRLRPGTFASFAQALSDCGVSGASLYAFPETSAAEWSGLARVTLDAAPVPACAG